MNYPITSSLPRAILIAVAIVCLLYACQLLLLPEGSRHVLYRIVWGNAISPAILAVFLCCIFLLMDKRVKLNRQRKLSRSFLDQVGPRLLDSRSRADASQFNLRDNLLATRWRSWSREQSSETSEDDSSYSERELERMQNSYAIARFFVWSLPIIGFIGTVWGIGQSIAFFSDTMSASQSGSSVSSMLQQNIPLVTKGLSTAFDTTLLALVLSLPATALLVLTERDERNLLSDLDEQWRSFIASRYDPVEELENEDYEHAQAVGESLRDMREQAFERYEQQLGKN